MHCNLKIKAFVDLNALRAEGVDIKSSHIRKHRNDVLGIVHEMTLQPIQEELNLNMINDIMCFTQMVRNDLDNKINLGYRRITIEKLLKRLENVLIIKD